MQKKNLSGRKEVQAAVDSLGCVNPRTALLLRQNFDIPSCLCCLYAVCPQGHSLTGSELAACLWPCVVMEKVLETLLDRGHISTTWKQVVCREATMEGEKGLLKDGVWRRGSRLLQRDRSLHCCLVFWTGRQQYADQLASCRTPRSVHHTKGHSLCRKVRRF